MHIVDQCLEQHDLLLNVGVATTLLDYLITG